MSNPHTSEEHTMNENDRVESYREITRALETGQGWTGRTDVPGYRELIVTVAHRRASVSYADGGIHLGEIADRDAAYDLRDHNRRFLASVDQTFQRALAVLVLLTTPEVERLDGPEHHAPGVRA